MRLFITPAAVLICLLYLLGGCKQTGQKTSSTISTTDDSLQTGPIRLTSLSADHTGVTFNNQIDDEGRVNIFTWHFLYNGAGVAAGDINNDGLPDLYFTGNMVPDKLYLNKGNFTFEDITSKAGIGLQIWSSGVTMADVNADGLLDIYVCKNSPTGIHDNNRNKLYINIGDNVFREQATQFGIDDIGFGVQSTFFDADQDGDLDMYLVNQPFDEFSKLVNRPEVVAAYPQTDRFFIFENGRFVDKTAAMGMTNARYGLNVSLGDFDMNGWTDMYICNDYHHADHLYMNNGGRFTDALHSHTGHISFYSMGSDVADVNHDGWLDIFTLDMAFEEHYRSKTNMGSMDRDRFWNMVKDRQHYQYMQNGLQVNVGHGYFSEMAQVAGIAKSDWSYACVFADLDHDTDHDILVTNGILRDLRNNDFNTYVKEKYQNMVGPDNYLEVLKNIPSTPIRNIIFHNEGNMRFAKLPPEAGFDMEGFSHGMAVADLDGDGKLDVVINNCNAPASIYKNETETDGNYINVRLKGPGNNMQGLGCSVMLYAGGEKQINTMQATRGYFSSSEPVLHFGLGAAEKVDSIKVYWDHRSMTLLKNVKVNDDLLINFDKAQKIPFAVDPLPGVEVADINYPLFAHREDTFDDYNLQVLLPYKLSQNGPHIAVADVNGDGSEDFFVGGGAGQASVIYTATENGQFQLLAQPAFEKDKAGEDQEAAFFDLEGDGDMDLVVTSGSNEFKNNSPVLRMRLYVNDGKGNFTSSQNLPSLLINGQCIEAFDADGDKDMDLFVGGRLQGGQYPMPASSKLLINEEGRLIDHSQKAAGFLTDFGLVTDAVADDIDKDGDQDLLVVGEWIAPAWMMNDGKGNFTRQDIDAVGVGLWWTVEKGDLDEDGDMDFILGNLGWNNKFGGSRGTKLEVYANDFDRNGDFDVVLANMKGDKLLPVRGRECSSQEMPFILDKFPTYESYAKAGLDEILTDEQLSSGTHQKLSTMSSVILINDGAGGFAKKEMHEKCQVGPVKALVVTDINDDLHLDYIYAGNHLPTEVETARYDGLYPGICFGDGKGNFDCQTIFIEGKLRIEDVRDMRLINAGGKEVLLISNSDGPLRMYALKEKPQVNF